MQNDHTTPAHPISTDHLSLEQIAAIIEQKQHLSLSPSAVQKISDCRNYLEQKIAQSDELIYGINTGFGSLCNVRISANDIEALQYNLVVSHAAGSGDIVPPEVVRIMLLLKIQSLSYGHSGVRLVLVERLIAMYNAGILPVIYELGSLGASGDLAPLAHLSLPLIGLGEVWYEGRIQRSDVVLQTLHWEPLRFQAKEALALLNGTQFSTGYGIWCMLQAHILCEQALLNAAIGFDGFNCRPDPLHPAIHRIRGQEGQISVAEKMRAYLEGSEISTSPKTSVQDPYAFRCVPQVHGASEQALAHIESVLIAEANAVTDNPNVFEAEDLVLSGGNFHAQPIALAMDYFAIVFAELGSIAERRIYQLISGQRGLPVFLTPDPGLHSGLMIAQYTAAAIVNQNKTLCAPASTDSIVSCNGQEDHVSMAANAATKARRVVQNVERILAIELICGMQALEYRRPLRSSALIENYYHAFRQIVPTLREDRIIHNDIEQSIGFIRSNMRSKTN